MTADCKRCSIPQESCYITLIEHIILVPCLGLKNLKLSVEGIGWCNATNKLNLVSKRWAHFFCWRLPIRILFCFCSDGHWLCTVSLHVYVLAGSGLIVRIEQRSITACLHCLTATSTQRKVIVVIGGQGLTNDRSRHCSTALVWPPSINFSRQPIASVETSLKLLKIAQNLHHTFFYAIHQYK